MAGADGKKIEHPARYSKEIVRVLGPLILATGAELVHDPFAGTGERLGALCDDLGVEFTGTEIEASFIVDPRVQHGNSADRATYPQDRRFIIVTSPTYPNGVADHHKANDDSERNTYRAAVKANEGEDRELHVESMARYGYRGTKRGGRSEKRASFWGIATRCVNQWDHASAVIVNVSDFKSNNGEIEPFSEDWMMLMERFRWRPVSLGQVSTPRLTQGSDKSRNERVQGEWIIHYE